MAGLVRTQGSKASYKSGDGDPHVPAPLLIPLPAADIQAIKDYVGRARAPATLQKYERDWATFSRWCASRSQENLPARPEVVAGFLAHEAKRGLKPPTLTRALAAIGYFHGAAGLLPPHRTSHGALVLKVLEGARRSRKVPAKPKQAAVSDIMLIVLSCIGPDNDRLADLRDRALLSFGMASAMRRSELVALDVTDLQFTERSVQVTIRRSKTDQDGVGEVIAIPAGRRLMPVDALRTWLDRAGITTGAVFRKVSSNGKRLLPGRLSDRGVARVVQARFRNAKYDPDLFAAHSLRSGFLTSAAEAGASVWKMREVSRHKSMQVLGGYVQRGNLLDDHAGGGFL
jgi:site-specific recombinase XerD